MIEKQQQPSADNSQAAASLDLGKLEAGIMNLNFSILKEKIRSKLHSISVFGIKPL
ncbi:hypothetical protein [Chryseobacterium sp. PCH239]|uniref:hypothetical protein n=1 Tax=Chryseobacterium sp. PCH239 TaxID=2825845 RepID=UPI00209FA889|nr:hypothetical protein [Chryseobacterium sp. PCH239]